MNKEQAAPGQDFWAKKFDQVACIIAPSPEYRTLCGKYNVLLGNNYADQLYEVCPECLKKLKK